MRSPARRSTDVPAKRSGSSVKALIQVRARCSPITG
jgi:hypothetical protein